MNKLLALWHEPLWNVAPEGSGGGTEPAPAPEPETSPRPEETTEPATLLGGKTPAEGGDAPPEPVTPLTAADITLPEGAEVSETAMTSFLEIMNNADFSAKERSEKLLALQHEFTASLLEDAGKQLQETWTSTLAEWERQAAALPEIGGKNLPQTLATIKKGLDAAGADPELYKALDITGAGTNPHVIKILHALTKNLTEGGPVSGSPTKGPLTHEQKMFGSMKQE